MSSDEGSPSGRRQQTARLLPSSGVRPRRRLHRPLDVRVEGDELVLTLQIPEIDDAELRYSLRSRYLLVWGEPSPSAHMDTDLIHLPRPVDPDQHVIRFRNGILDIRAKIADRT